MKSPFRSKPAGASAPMRWCSRIVRSTRRPIACPAARLALPGSPSTPRRTSSTSPSTPRPRRRPREKLTLPVQIDGPRGRRRGLCHGGGGRYRHPQPHPLPDARSARAFLTASALLSTEIRDIYGLLIDGLQGARGQIRSGGDGGGPETSAEKPSQEPLALYSGIVRVGPDGKAEVAFDLPAFNGSVRVTAVAWSKSADGLGQRRRDRARSRRGAGQPAALPGARRPVAAQPALRQCRRRGWRLQADARPARAASPATPPTCARASNSAPAPAPWSMFPCARPASAPPPSMCG